MKVLGYEVPQSVIDNCIIRMKYEDRFRLSNIISVAILAGAPAGEISYRIADRLIQRERKAGNIVLIYSAWTWIGKP